MGTWDEEFLKIIHKGQMFTVTKLGHDISESLGKPAGAVEMSHKIDGFEVPLYMVIDTKEGFFGFVHKVMQDGTDKGLFVTLQDETLFNEICEFVEHIETSQ